MRSLSGAAGGLALTLAFVWFHGAEVGALPAATQAVLTTLRQHGVIGLSAALESAVGALAACLVVLGWYGAGDLVVRFIARHDPAPPASEPALLALARRCALGSGVCSHLWFALGLVALYQPATALAALVLGLAAFALARSGGAKPLGSTKADRLGERSPLESLVLLSVALLLALGFVAALAPPTAKDALQYHIALPKAWLAAGALVDVPSNIAGLLALGGEMNGLWGMLLGRLVSLRSGEAAFGAVMFAYFPLLLALVYGWVRERGLGRAWSLTASAMVASAPVAWEVAGSGYVDLALALYVALAFHAVARWWTSGRARHLGELALALGFALSVKLPAAAALVLMLLLVALNARRVKRCDPAAATRIALAGLAALVAALVIGSPWYLRTWVLTGSPVFPFLGSLWPSQAAGWDEARSVMLDAFNAQYGGDPKGPIDYLLAPIRVALMGQRGLPAYYESVLGVAFLAGVPAVVLALGGRRLHADFALAATGATWLFTWWVFSVQVLRYLLPALPLAAVAVVGAAAAIRGAAARPLAWAVVTATLGGQLVIAAWFVADNPLLVVLGGEPRAMYLSRRLEHYPYYRVINDTLAPNARVWLIDVRRDTYHLERPYVGDYLFENYTLQQWVREASSAAELDSRARAAGITHVLARHDLLFDPARSPFTNDGRPEAENRAKLTLLRAFLVEDARILRGDRRFVLVELPGEPSRAN